MTGSATHRTNPESHAARMALLKIAVRKVPFTVKQLRTENPELLGEIVRGQVRRLENEGLITRMALGTYVATCVLHLFDGSTVVDEQSPAARMPKDEVLDYASKLRTFEEIRSHFKVGKDVTRERLNDLVEEGCLHKRKIGVQVLFSKDERPLQKAAAEHKTKVARNKANRVRTKNVSPVMKQASKTTQRAYA